MGRARPTPDEERHSMLLPISFHNEHARTATGRPSTPLESGVRGATPRNEDVVGT